MAFNRAVFTFLHLVVLEELNTYIHTEIQRCVLCHRFYFQKLCWLSKYLKDYPPSFNYAIAVDFVWKIFFNIAD